MPASIIYTGIEGHKDSLTLAILPSQAAIPTRLDLIPNDGTPASGGASAPPTCRRAEHRPDGRTRRYVMLPCHTRFRCRIPQPVST